MATGMVVLFITLVVVPHPYGMHGGIWALLLNTLVAWGVSMVSAPPSAQTVKRVHGEIEKLVYGTEE
jgi:Na+/proline symporter